MAKKRKRKSSTALARRPKVGDVRLSVVPQSYPIMPAPRDVGDDLALGQLGLVEIKLTAEEETILARPVDPKDVLIKPTAHPVPYISHPTYTRWLNEAFGRTGWALVPISKPIKSGSSVCCPYVLHIHGKPVAYAMGEQEYFEGNKDQTYGDALESTVASALRRCMKRLGVGLELWDRRWLNEWIAEYAVRVKREGGKSAWRRKDEPRFFDEQGRTPGGDERQGPPEQAPAGHHAAAKDVITGPQLNRLWAIGESSGRAHDEIKSWLQKKFGFASSKDITRDKYEYICAAIEGKGPLPA